MKRSFTPHWPFTNHSSRNQTAQRTPSPEKFEKSLQQKEYAQFLEDQLQLKRAESIRHQYENHLLDEMNNSYAATAPANKQIPRRRSKTVEEMQRTVPITRQRSYSNDLEMQMKQRELKKMVERQYDTILSNEVFDPFGRPGAGAPLVDNTGDLAARRHNSEITKIVDVAKFGSPTDPTVMNEYREVLDRQLLEKVSLFYSILVY